VRALEKRGFVVEDAATFCEKLREVSLLPLDVAKVRRSIESLDRGDGIPLKQALDELRCGKG
jgi:hypothetical protein